jgi:ribosome-binding protein aMBF1 (putative translation factor)
MHNVHQDTNNFDNSGSGNIADERRILRDLGTKVRKFRAEQGLSQEELGEKAGLHRTYIGSIERSERNVSLLNIQRIAKALGVSVVMLL